MSWELGMPGKLKLSCDPRCACLLSYLYCFVVSFFETNGCLLTLQLFQEGTTVDVTSTVFLSHSYILGNVYSSDWLLSLLWRKNVQSGSQILPAVYRLYNYVRCLLSETGGSACLTAWISRAQKPYLRVCGLVMVYCPKRGLCSLCFSINLKSFFCFAQNTYLNRPFYFSITFLSIL